MNKQAFIELLKNPASMNASDLKGLEEVIYNYPYFQAAHLLAAKGFKDQGKMLAEQKVRKAAAYAGERASLKKLLSKFNNGNKGNKKDVKKSEGLVLPVVPVKQSEEPLKPFLPDQVIQKLDPVVKEPSIKEESTPGSREEDKEVKKAANANNITEDIRKTLSSLRETMAKLSEAPEENIAPTKGETSGVQELATDQMANTLEIIQPFREEKTTKVQADLNASTELIPEKIKEHNTSDLLFSSRLDEVIDNSDNDRFKKINEGDLLLDYLSFLEMSKKSVQDKKKTEEIIEKFIREDPTIPPLSKAKLVEEQEDKASGSYTLKSSPLSESMAKILLLQGKKDKAVEIYNQLILKYPKKKDYFASQIEKIK